MKRYLSVYRSMVLILLIMMAWGQCFAQLTSRALGMGLAYTALARGVHAVDWNPANLGLPDNPGFSISIFSVGAGVGNNSFSISTYNKYATDKYWDANEIDELLNDVPDDGLGVDALADAKVLSFSIGRFAFSAGIRGGGAAFLDKTVLEIPLKGTEVEKTYHFDKMDATTLAVGSIKLSYGAPIKVSFAEDFAIGGSVHFDFGGAYGKVDSSKMALEIGTYGFNIDGKYVATAASFLSGGCIDLGAVASGWGIDFGAAAKIGKKWTVSLGILNLIGPIRWNKNVKEYFGYVRGDSIGVLDFTKEEKDKKDLVQDSSWTVDGKAFSRNAPAELHAGGLYEEGPYVLTADYIQGFRSQGWVTTKPRFAFGMEWRKVKWLPLRIGMVIGGRIGFGSSFGFGLRPGKFVLDIGLMNRGFILPYSSKGMFASVEMGVGL